MSKFIAGTVFGFIIASVGVSGSITLVEQGVSKIKGYAPVIESTVTDMKRHISE